MTVKKETVVQNLKMNHHSKKYLWILNNATLSLFHMCVKCCYIFSDLIHAQS